MGNTAFRKVALVTALSTALLATAQSADTSSASNPFHGSVTVHPATAEKMRLSLDGAVELGLRNNLGLREAESDLKSFEGQKKQALQLFLPNITLTADTGAHQHNLVAVGFGPGVVSQFAKLLGGSLDGFSPITRDELTEGTVQFSQTLFSGPVIAGWKAAGAAERAAHFGVTRARGEVVQQVATTYLYCLAAQAEVDQAQAQLASSREFERQAVEAHAAGVAANLDELRAKVERQAREQALISAQNTFEKTLILLKREIGLDPGQQIELTDPAPYSSLAEQKLDELKATAYRYRQDYQKLQNESVEMAALHTAYRAQRLPSLSFNGQYAVSQVGGAGSHGNFIAAGAISMPLFREAKLRGDIDVAAAQQRATLAQLADKRTEIEEQLRMALLDIDAGQKLVDVARSNVELAIRALADESSRVSAGVDDNLPLVEAQTALSSAQSNQIESLYQYNVAKLELARATGLIEQQYKSYLGQ